MRTKISLGTFVFAASFMFSMPAMALNPQPEPPKPYHGFEIVIVEIRENDWQWAIRKPSSGSALSVLDSGVGPRSRDEAVMAAQRAIDLRTTARPTVGQPPSASVGPRFKPVARAFKPVQSTFLLSCHWAFFGDGLVFRNDGLADVPVGTKVSYQVHANPAYAEGVYTFEYPLPPGGTAGAGRVLKDQHEGDYPTCNIQVE